MIVNGVEAKTVPLVSTRARVETYWRCVCGVENSYSTVYLRKPCTVVASRAMCGTDNTFSVRG